MKIPQKFIFLCLSGLIVYYFSYMWQLLSTVNMYAFDSATHSVASDFRSEGIADSLRRARCEATERCLRALGARAAEVPKHIMCIAEKSIVPALGGGLAGTLKQSVSDVVSL